MVLWVKIANMKKHTSINHVDRSKTKVIFGSDNSSGFVDLPPSECVAMVWELTRELWSLGGDTSAEQRLQRDVAVLIKNKSFTGREKDRLDARQLQAED